MEYTFYIDVSYHEMEYLYKGIAQRIIVKETQGRTISIPAIRFQPYLRYSGVQGWFKLTTSAEGKFISLKPLDK